MANLRVGRRATSSDPYPIVTPEGKYLVTETTHDRIILSMDFGGAGVHRVIAARSGKPVCATSPGAADVEITATVAAGQLEFSGALIHILGNAADFVGKNAGGDFVSAVVPVRLIRVGAHGGEGGEGLVEAQRYFKKVGDSDEKSDEKCCCWWGESSDPFREFEEEDLYFPPLIGSDGKEIAYSDDVMKAKYTLLAKQHLERKTCGNSCGMCWTGMGYIAALIATTALIITLTSMVYDQVRIVDRCFANQSLYFNSTFATDICSKQLQGQTFVRYEAPTITGGIVLFSAVITIFAATISSLYKSPYFIESFFPRPWGMILESIIVAILMAISFGVNAAIIIIVLIELHTSSFLVASFAAAVSIPVVTSVFAAVVYQYLPSFAGTDAAKG